VGLLTDNNGLLNIRYALCMITLKLGNFKSSIIVRLLNFGINVQYVKRQFKT